MDANFFYVLGLSIEGSKCEFSVSDEGKNFEIDFDAAERNVFFFWLRIHLGLLDLTAVMVCHLQNYIVRYVLES